LRLLIVLFQIDDRGGGAAVVARLHDGQDKKVTGSNTGF